MTALEYEVPPGVPSAVKIKVAAAVLNFEERPLAEACRAGSISAFKLTDRKGAVWYIPTAEITRLAEQMMTEPNWELAL